MSTSFRHAHPCPGDVATAWAALSGEGWAVRRAEVLGDGSRVVSRTQAPDGGVELVVSRELPAGGPGFLERFLPRDGRVEQADSWAPDAGDGVREGTWSAALPGAPATLGGAMRLEPRADGCRWVVEGTVTVRVPLVGGRAEAYLAEMLGRLTATEAEVLRGMV